MNWRAKPSLGGAIGIALSILAFAAFGAVLWQTLSAALESYDDDPSPGANLGTFGLGLAAFGLALLVVLLAYRTWRFFQVRYYLDRNAIKIELGGKRQVIPLANVRQVITAESLLEALRQGAYGEEIPTKAGERSDGTKVNAYSQPRTQTIAQRVETTNAADSDEEDSFWSEVAESEVVEAEVIEGTPAADSDNHSVVSKLPTEGGQKPAEKKRPEVHRKVAFKVKTRPLTSWPGFYTNQGWLASLGEIQFYSTEPFAKTVLVRTANKTYALSPAEPKQFITEYRLRRNLGAIEAVEEGIIRGKFLSHPLWHDWLGRGLILTGVLANLALFAFLLSRFADLPPILRLHYNKFGVVDRLESASAIFWLPAIGLFTAIINSIIGAILHPLERVPALLLYGSIIAVQLLIWIAAIGIIVTSGA